MATSKSTIGNLIAEATQMLDQSGVPDAQRQVSLLMAHALGADRTFVISHRDDEVNPDIVANFHAFVVRRAAGEPLQYITGYQEFFKLRFEVTPDVLIPRP